ncbi:PucR C-terminal helix-turn-helix domain-containing protein [Thermomonospora echinospora]|uniref:PucR C-terminal helix-turn-helix domain-containing protein n=1 Tax=Thermomonospora echinospora TaxID=1992 RepID=A0A1H6EC32_9ACTN|nr:helix-turn-helix domain-containing protein [Thermomonospora echinospora]SEG94599.1 PucR C-terminal helix-turn-helix domain-containing protein [Thermomonospora echinospora]
MTEGLTPETLEEPFSLPPHLARLMRPELPSLTNEIIAQIRRAIPEYARPIEGPYGQTLRLGVERALGAFVDQIAGATGDQARRDELCRRLGQFEAQEGRSLDSLQAAYRIGAQVAWRRVMRIGGRYNVSAQIISKLAEELFNYIDELSSLSLEGYLEAKARPAGALEERRRRLLRLLLTRPPVPEAAVAELAHFAEWAVPDELTMVAVPSGARAVRTILDPDILYDLADDQPHLLVPGPLDAGRRAMLEAALPESRIAVGLTVEPAGAADSLRWARQALDLVADGVIDDGRMTMCADHLLTLWLLADRALLDQLARRRLGAMDELTANQRERLTETLRTWLATRGTAAQIADLLHIHPQTVRYRIRKLELTLGDQLADPDARFAIEVVLRATWLREQARSVRRGGGPPGRRNV